MAPFSLLLSLGAMLLFLLNQEKNVLQWVFHKCTNLENGKAAERVNNILLITQLFRP